MDDPDSPAPHPSRRGVLGGVLGGALAVGASALPFLAAAVPARAATWLARPR